MTAPADPYGAFVPGPRAVVEPLAAGPLTGLSFAVKDLIDVAGVVTGGGNPDWQRGHAPATRHAPAVERLLRAGARLIGKTLTDELAFSLEGANQHYGTPVNPRCPDRLPGGSSSGSAVAVAAGLADIALGTDTGGSVRVPASFCGIFGFRPTHGRIPLDGVIPFAPSYDTIGWFARDGVTLAAAGAVLLGSGATSAPSRLLLARDAFELCDKAAAETLKNVAAPLGIAGEVTLFDGAAAEWLECYRVLQGAEIWASLGPWITAVAPRFGADIAPRFADAARISADLVAAFQPVRTGITSRLRALLPPATAMLLPTAPSIALRQDAPAAAIGAFYRLALTLACAAGHAGLPHLSLPVAQVAGCPIGLSVIAASGADDALLALAARPAIADLCVAAAAA